MRLINNTLLDEVSELARNNERLRMNHNFHANLDDAVHKLLNALEPGTVLPVHRHLHSAEAYIILRGSVRVLFYNDAKCLTEDAILSHQTGCVGVDIPVGQWHTLEVLEAGTVIYEVKQGPYIPISAADTLIIDQ